MCKRVVLMIVLALFSVSVAYGQGVVTGTIVGTVVDSTGGAIPNAQVTALNQDTGLSRTATSGEDGAFRIPQLNSGNYTVSVEAPGLTKSQMTGVVVSVGGEVRVDLKMSVAATTTEVQVSGEAAVAVNTEQAAVSTLMSTSAIEEVPLNARDVQQLASIQPGVQADPNNDNWGSQIVIAGSRPQQNRYLNEGVDTTWTSKTAPVSAAGVVLGVEAVKEFQVLESNYTAEYGERAGGTLNTIWKSGTNSLHGSGYGYVRNSWFDAMGFFDHQNIVTLPDGSKVIPTKPPGYKRYQFGGAVGGPIKKDKHFFFANYEGYRHHLGITNLLTVPDDNALGFTGPGAGTNTGSLPCGAFAGANFDPTSLLITTAPSPAIAGCTVGASATLLETIPSFKAGPGTFIGDALALMEPRCSGTNVALGSCTTATVGSQVVSEDFLVGKTDFTLGPNDNLTVSYKRDISLSNSPQQNPNFNLRQQYRTQIGSARETHIFSPTFLNTFTFGGNRTFFLWYLGWGGATPVPATLGTGVNAASPFTTPGNGAYLPTDTQQILPIITATGLTNIASFTTGTTVTPRQMGYNQGSLLDDVDIIRGKHAFKFGGQYKRWHDNVYNSAGTYQGTVAFTSIQNLLINSANTFGQTLPGPYSDVGRGWRTWLLGFYAQDSYKPISNLTITAGIRWEYVPGPHEALNRITNLQNPYTDTAPEAGYPYFRSSPRNIEPRIGIAWDPFKNGKTSVRAGFGIFHDEIEAYNYFIGEGHNPPFAINVALKTSTVLKPSWPVPPTDQMANFVICSSMWTALNPPPTTPNACPAGSIPQTANQGFQQVMPLNPKTPVKYSYNFEVQKQLPDRFIMSVGYVGSFGRQLGVAYNYSNFLPIVQTPGSAPGCPAASLYNCYFFPGTGGTGGVAPAPLQCNDGGGKIGTHGVPPTCSIYLTPNWSSVTGAQFDTNAFYNSLEFRLQRHIGTGANMSFGYTHVSCITDSAGESPGQNLNGGNTPTIDSIATSSRARCAFTASDVANFTLSYDIPFAKSSTGLVKALFANWEITSLTSVDAGFPLNVLTGYNYMHNLPTAATGQDRPNLAAGCTYSNAVRPGQEYYIVPTCFTPNTPGYGGTLVNNALTGPAYWNTDASLKKEFALHGERMRLRLQVDMFNVFNRANLGEPNATQFPAFTSKQVPNTTCTAAGVCSGTFGQIQNMAGVPRQLQLGARFVF